MPAGERVVLFVLSAAEMGTPGTAGGTGRAQGSPSLALGR